MTKKMFVGQAIAFVLAWLALPFLLACDTGCEEHGGVCACDAKAEVAPEVKPSDDLPPNHGGKREAVFTATAKFGVEPSTDTANDYRAERDRR